MSTIWLFSWLCVYFGSFLSVVQATNAIPVFNGNHKKGRKNENYRHRLASKHDRSLSEFDGLEKIHSSEDPVTRTATQSQQKSQQYKYTVSYDFNLVINWNALLPNWQCKNSPKKIEYCSENNEPITNTNDRILKANMILWIIKQYTSRSHTELNQLGLDNVLFLGDYLIAEFGLSANVRGTQLYQQWYGEDDSGLKMNDRINVLQKIYNLKGRREKTVEADPLQIVRVCKDYDAKKHIMDCFEYVYPLWYKYHLKSREFDYSYSNIEWDTDIVEKIEAEAAEQKDQAGRYVSLLYYMKGVALEETRKADIIEAYIKSIDQDQNAYMSYFPLVDFLGGEKTYTVSELREKLEEAKQINAEYFLTYLGLADLSEGEEKVKHLKEAYLLCTKWYLGGSFWTKELNQIGAKPPQ